MFNKLQFNNLIISNKATIQQAQIQTFNKLVKKSRKCKVSLEKSPKDAKTEGRLRKNNECLEQLKKLNRWEIVKSILLLEKDPYAVITNGQASPDEVAIAMLATNTLLQSLIKLIREKLNLYITNQEEWRNKLIEPSKRCSKKNKIVVKQQKRKELKEQKTVERKRIEWLSDNKGLINEDDKSKNITCNEFTELLEPDVGPLHVEKLPKHVDHKQPKVKNTKIQMTNEEMEETKTQNKMQTFKEKHVKENTKVISHEPIVDKIICDESELTHIVDPFFITATGHTYLSTIVKKDFTSSTNEILSDRNTTKGKYGSNRQINKTNRQNDYVSSINQCSWNQELKSVVPEDRRKPKVTKKIQPQTELHPSWVAKQKLKPIMASFQGKRIKFDYEDD